MRKSRIQLRKISFSISLFAVSCSYVGSHSYPNSLINEQSQISGLTSSYGAVSDHLTKSFLQKLNASFLKDHFQNPSGFQIHIVPTKEIFALSSSDGQVFISSCLVEKAKRFESFLFIISHEIGHYLSRHREKINSEKISEIDAEIEADRVGLQFLTESGFDIQNGIQTLKDFSLVVHGNFQSMHQRISSAESYSATRGERALLNLYQFPSKEVRLSSIFIEFREHLKNYASCDQEVS